MWYQVDKSQYLHRPYEIGNRFDGLQFFLSSEQITSRHSRTSHADLVRYKK